MVEEKTSLEVSARYLQGPIFPRVKVKIRIRVSARVKFSG